MKYYSYDPMKYLYGFWVENVVIFVEFFTQIISFPSQTQGFIFNFSVGEGMVPGGDSRGLNGACCIRNT